MKYKAFFIYIFFWYSNGYYPAYSQPKNLIENPGFEPLLDTSISYFAYIVSPENGIAFTTNKSIRYVSTDSMPVLDSSEYYINGWYTHLGVIPQLLTSVNYCETVVVDNPPRNGCGCLMLMPELWWFGDNYSGKLIDSLVKGQKYKINFWIKFANNDYFIMSEIGLKLSENLLNFNTQTAQKDFSLKPDIVIGKEYLADTNWTEIEVIYLAKGGEKFLHIGTFYNKEYHNTSEKKMEFDKNLSDYFKEKNKKKPSESKIKKYLYQSNNIYDGMYLVNPNYKKEIIKEDINFYFPVYYVDDISLVEN